MMAEAPRTRTTNGDGGGEETQQCQGCSQSFPSRNAIFRHLRETNGACLSPENHKDFVRYAQSKKDRKKKKVLLLYGYLPCDEYLCLNPSFQQKNDNNRIRNGEDAARLILDTIQSLSCSSSSSSVEKEEYKINRSYGYTSHGTDMVAQDDGTGAITEVLAAQLAPVPDSSSIWLQKINTELQTRLTSSSSSGGGQVRVLGRLEMSYKKFNAEMDVTHRRVEYLLPIDFLMSSTTTTTTTTKSDRQDFLDSLVSFASGHNPYASFSEGKPQKDTLTYLYQLKKVMQRLTTHIEKLDPNDEAAVLEKEFHDKKRKRQRKKQLLKKKQEKDRIHHKSNKESNNPPKKNESMDNNNKTLAIKDDSKATDNKNDNNENDNNFATEGKNVLRRRRFHNFTPRVMAHEFLAFRRLDRMYHRATLRFPEQTNGDNRPFFAISLTGDLFLNGQACRVLGVFVALVRGVVEEDIVECLFDEQYPHLVPAPPVPPLGLYAGEATYMSWEGKAQAILSPRETDRYEKGWNSDDTLQRVANWQGVLQEKVAEAWFRDGCCKDTGRLKAEERWTNEVLEPWAKQAREQLKEYRQWKVTTKEAEKKEATEDAAVAVAAAAACLPSPDMVDSSVPAAFEKVLHFLREADASGLWPTTTPKRQLVMVSTQNENDNETGSTSITTKQPSSLSMAHIIAKSNKEKRSSAYSFAEGEGGASGSFSVGAMPGGKCIQPKGNTLFPELTKAAFELEMALMPNREPSSTIAINRNAQFRPHTDSGAGAGQSTSLIVGLGTYSGGELVVEGEKKDIRYTAIEFNGWTQRHWTMPFRGERFSLVWFTPKGCEGVRGIDLCE